MIRRTSIETYNRIREGGLLGRLQWQVYDVIYKHGPLTQNELHREYFPHTQPRNVQPRVSELARYGCVFPVGVRACRITGNVCVIWDVTESVPAPYKRRKVSEELETLREQFLVVLGRLQEVEKRLVPQGGAQGYFFK